MGHIFSPDGSLPWMRTHAANPVARHMGGDIFRIYFSGRDEENRAHISWVEINILNPAEILRICDKPVLSPGSPGHFDDSGVSMGCLAEIDGKVNLFYLGWNLGVTVPWRNSIGRAIEQEDGSFVKAGHAPALDRCEADPFTISYPWILPSGDGFHIWYGSNLAWGSEQTDMDHVLKYGWSRDGTEWQRNGDIAIPQTDKSEYAFSKPCVIRDEDRFRMWFSFRGDRYRIGYAESSDGKTWIRMDDKAGIDVSDFGWDSQSVEYPNVFDHGSKRYMLYNGNSYGSTGFGLAISERSSW